MEPLETSKVAMPYVPERDRKWHMGLCGEYALALQRNHPELRLGYMEQMDPEHEPDWENPPKQLYPDDWEPEPEPWYIQHIFAHDDNFIYDIYGKTPIAAAQDYTNADGVAERYTLNQTVQDIHDVWPIDQPLVDDAHRRIQDYSSPSELPKTSRLQKSKEDGGIGWYGGDTIKRFTTIKRFAGKVPETPQERQQLTNEGWLPCRIPTCDYMLAPQDYESAEDNDYYFSCPNCKKTYELIAPTPFSIDQQGRAIANPDAANNPHGEPIPGIKNRQYETFVGLTMKQQGDIGENIVKGLKVLGDYGQITWWSSNYNDPIDGGAGEWAIEVKTLCIDVNNHRFIPGNVERKDKMVARATELGFKGILGVLVLLDYRRSVADIYTMEMPLGPWIAQNGKPVQGPVAFRKHNGQQLLTEIPFDNPFLNPNFNDPQGYKVYNEDDIPF
jgi:hypothetical protein